MRCSANKISLVALAFGLALAVGPQRAAIAADAGETTVYQRTYGSVETLLADASGPAPLLLAQVSDDDTNDPLEPVNRAIFGFNQVVYEVLFTPIAKVYNANVPKTVRSGLSNAISNLASPVVFINDLLQLEFERAMTTFVRFLVNSTAGIGGIADVAGESGTPKHSEDFGQTLGVYGVGEGFYLVLPILGPSNPRDAIGKYLVDPYFDPLGMWFDNTDRDVEKWSRVGVTGLVEYAAYVDQLEQIKKTSVDYYAAIRSLYRQRRAAEISNGRDSDMPPIPNYDINFAPDASDGVAGVK